MLICILDEIGQLEVEKLLLEILWFGGHDHLVSQLQKYQSN